VLEIMLLVNGSGGSRYFEKGGGKTISALSSFIANAHNELYKFILKQETF